MTTPKKPNESNAVFARKWGMAGVEVLQQACSVNDLAEKEIPK